MHPLIDYFRCPEQFASLGTAGPLPADPGYFRFGDAICYGRQSVGAPSSRPDGDLVDVAQSISHGPGSASLPWPERSRRLARGSGTVLLPFDLSEVLDNLRFERYRRARGAMERFATSRVSHALYYFFRPILPVGVRKHVQKLSLSGWRRIAFPQWPVDVTVETLMRGVVGLALERGGVREMPFIWFWPDGAPGCAMVTHDVEGPSGAGRASEMMDLDDSFGIKSAFQLGPEAKTTTGLRESCRRRGFEVNVHDLNHDGHLFGNKALFDRRVVEINRCAREWGCRGFRSGAMNRRQDWFSALEVAFDMSVPNVAHLEAQRGGCCTVMPHFIGDVLELPLTTVQDYSLFHVLGDHSVELWKEQIERILAEHGLVSVIVHPDYQVGKRERDVYVGLLTHLARLRAERPLWVALPSEIDRWWRDRHQMKLVPDGESWRIEGPGSARARVAYARLVDGCVAYEVDSMPCDCGNGVRCDPGRARL